MVEKHPQVPRIQSHRVENGEQYRFPDESVQERRELMGIIKNNVTTLFNEYRPRRTTRERREHMREFRQGVRSEILHISFLENKGEKCEYFFQYDTTGFTFRTSQNEGYIWTNGENKALTEEKSQLRNVENEELEEIIHLTELASSSDEVDITYSVETVRV